jgi:hypothetical protein
MSDVTVQGLADLLLRLPDEPLGAGAVPSTPFEAALEKTTVLLERSPGLTLTASPSISISVFNAPEDRDPDGLVESAGRKATSTRSGACAAAREIARERRLRALGRGDREAPPRRFARREGAPQGRRGEGLAKGPPRSRRARHVPRSG